MEYHTGFLTAELSVPQCNTALDQETGSTEIVVSLLFSCGCFQHTTTAVGQLPQQMTVASTYRHVERFTS